MEKRVTCLGGVDRPVWRSRSKYSTGLSLARGSNGLQLIPPSDARCSISLRDYVQSWINMLIALTKRKNKKKKCGGWVSVPLLLHWSWGWRLSWRHSSHPDRQNQKKEKSCEQTLVWLTVDLRDWHTHTHTDKMDDAFDVGNTGQCVCACVVIYDLCQSTHSCIS